MISAAHLGEARPKSAPTPTNVARRGTGAVAPSMDHSREAHSAAHVFRRCLARCRGPNRGRAAPHLTNGVTDADTAFATRATGSAAPTKTLPCR